MNVASRSTRWMAAWAVSLMMLESLAFGQSTVLMRPAGETGTTVVPDRFLRRWDPVTVFFTRDLGPRAGGPEDRPARFVKLVPDHPGAYSWLDSKTLQFKPAEPWPSLQRFNLSIVDGEGARAKGVTLSTLMSAPVETHPRDGAEALQPFDEITLKMPEPVDPVALSQMISIELRSLPGIGGGPSRTLSRADFSVKAIERQSRSEGAEYTVSLAQKAPTGTRVVLHLRLSLDDRDVASFKDLSFSTMEPFRVVGFGCRNRQVVVTPEGTRYTREQAIRCGENRTVVVEFSAAPRVLGPVEARNLVRFTPAVNGLSFALNGRTLEISGGFDWETLYNVSLVPAPVTDTDGRVLDLRGKSELFLYFPRRPAYVRWDAGQGVVERSGPQMVPISGRGQDRVDLRVHAISPLDRSFWPFPVSGLSTDESTRPPGPGEEPLRFSEATRAISPSEITSHIRNLGSPPVSALVSLPLRREGSAASFGLDLAPHFARIAGKGQPGSYLVGIRQLDGQSQRSWMRVQVTDLALATIEEPFKVRFEVTSLSTGQPVPGARVRVEGSQNVSWVTFVDGTTGPDGYFAWPAPGHESGVNRSVRRIVVEKGNDVLVLDPAQPPERFQDNQWSSTRESWLDWVFSPLAGRGPLPETLLHIFTERPVYRPEEDVYIKGYVRSRDKGTLVPAALDGAVVVEGPGGMVWRYPVTVSPLGSFHLKFSEKNLPTGSFTAFLEDARRSRLGSVSFQMEAYRIPEFEVEIHAPDVVPLDKSFKVSLTATYYAGGKVEGQPVAWRVTQFPYDWTPKMREGFRFSSDGRFSRTEKFRATPRLEKQDATDTEGAAAITLNPSIEPTAQPRTYVVEATVTGADDQTVTATRKVTALPPFVLGIKLSRYVEKAVEISPEIIAVGPDGNLIAGKDITVRLLRRQWHSVLRASDFSDGIARYLTDVVDEKVSEMTVKSGAAPLKLQLPTKGAGVYVVELEARDRLDRAQTVAVDLYAGGAEPVSWPKPVSRVFAVSTDQARYDPGATASIVLKSPFQTARALAVIEAPEGNDYRWIDVAGGTATFKVPVKSTWVPRLPVHFLLMRGRVAGTGPVSGNATDLGKPVTMAATAWLEVNPVANRVEVKLVNPPTARPAQKIEVAIHLTDPRGKPLPGEVTLWLVDQAVLALGKEQRLDPLPDFITPVRSRLVFRDTRNGVFGLLPFAESPGGDEGAEGGLLDRTTVRKNFKTVPFYDPAIQVGPDGVAHVTVELPDNLTNFKLRAKAISGPDRFGYGTSQVSVRLPVIVQPALPRFVRGGDSFTGSAIGRIVEGKGGPGSAEVRLEGMKLKGPARRELTFSAGKPERIDFEVEVPTPAVAADGSAPAGEVKFRVAVARTSDQASDAFEVSLPVRPDRDRVTKRLLADLKPGTPVTLPGVPEAPRAGTLRRSILVSDQPGLVKMAAGLDFFLEYPYGCTEQQLSRARAFIALRKFRSLLAQKSTSKNAGVRAEAELKKAVTDTEEWIAAAVDSEGLVAYWPGSRGYVSLTAWSVQLLAEAKEAGFSVDGKLLERLTATLEHALRSDYSRFIDGESFVERAWALLALAQAGKFDAAYAAELARSAQFLRLENVAGVVQAFARSKDAKSGTVEALRKKLWDGLVIRLYQGHETYGGLQTNAWGGSGLVLPSETRTVAEISRALAQTGPANPRLQLLIDALVTLGRDDGWGSTNANASALLALSQALQPPYQGSTQQTVTVRQGSSEATIEIGPNSPVGVLSAIPGSPGESVEVSLKPSIARVKDVVVRAETSYVPEADGSHVAPAANGFVVTREQLIWKGEGAPMERRPLAEAGSVQKFEVGDVVEEHVQIVNPKERHYLAIVVPLAAGMEPLNPALKTAPSEAKPAGILTKGASYVQFLDDQVAFYYDTLPAGTFDFYFRIRATVAGAFIQPPAKAEMMYDSAVKGTSAGAKVVITRAEK